MQIPTFLGPYQLIHKIGEGGLAEIFLALIDGKAVAVKCLKPDHLDKVLSVESFVREVRIGSRLDHPNIPRVIDQGKIGNVAFVVMDLINGVNLEQVMAHWQRQQKTMPLPLTLHLIRQVGETLSYLHSTSVFEHAHGVLFHGDLSPKNIMLSLDGAVHLLDYGSSSQTTEYELNRQYFGRLHYLPPEVLGGRAVGTDTDVYALAVMAYLSLFGKLPFAEGQSKLELIDTILKQPVPKVDGSHILATAADTALLQIFFNRALHKDPTLRFATVTEFLEQFFRLRFAVTAPANPLEVVQHYGDAVLAGLQVTTQEWQAKHQEYLNQALSQKIPPQFRLESLLTKAERRKHPRIPTKPREAYIEVVLPKERTKIMLEVHELSPGGMLVKWEGTQPSIGEHYPVTLHLKNAKQPVRAVGVLKYEVAKKRRTYVGLECSWNAHLDQEQVSQFVANVLLPVGQQVNLEPQGSLCLDVYYRSMGEFIDEFEKNLRHGGVYVRSPKSFSNNDTIILRVQLPNRLGKINLRGKVVYCSELLEQGPVNTEHGIGVQLEANEAQLRSLFQIQ